MKFSKHSYGTFNDTQKYIWHNYKLTKNNSLKKSVKIIYASLWHNYDTHKNTYDTIMIPFKIYKRQIYDTRRSHQLRHN